MCCFFSGIWRGFGTAKKGITFKDISCAGRQWMKYSFDNTPGLGEKLNRLAREEMKLRLLRDIHTDITVCKLEGWDYHGYLDELQELIESIKARAGTTERGSIE